jgi:30S ribosomal protein S31
MGLSTYRRAAANASLYSPSCVINLEPAGMGKGDLRTRRGKIYNGSFGKKRPGRPKKAKETGQTAPARMVRKG